MLVGAVAFQGEIRQQSLATDSAETIKRQIVEYCCKRSEKVQGGYG